MNNQGDRGGPQNGRDWTTDDTHRRPASSFHVEEPRGSDSESVARLQKSRNSWRNAALAGVAGAAVTGSAAIGLGVRSARVEGFLGDARSSLDQCQLATSQQSLSNTATATSTAVQTVYTTLHAPGTTTQPSTSAAGAVTVEITPTAAQSTAATGTQGGQGTSASATRRPAI
ncbi:hypothetical protein IAU59_004579 [Kwoniella sp. CBS 9459]